MKGIWKKNQIIITALVLMVAVAGYLNFSDKNLSEGIDWVKLAERPGKDAEEQEGKAEETINEGVEIKDETNSAEKIKDSEATEVAEGTKEIKENETKEELLDEGEEEVGEAVLTSAKSNQAFYSIKMQREQTRAENKEMLTEIINNVNATEQQKNEAIDAIMEIAKISEKENAAETLLSAKGFPEAVVSMEKNHVDVVIDKGKLNDQELTQIEDIVTRKTEVALENIVISTTKNK